MEVAQTSTGDVKSLNLQNNTYTLYPSRYEVEAQHYDCVMGFERYAKYCQSVFNRQPEAMVSELDGAHVLDIQHCIPRDTALNISQLMKVDIKQVANYTTLEKLLAYIFSPELDSALISYFKSEYLVYWHTFQIQNHDDGECSTSWHCDAGPSNHLKLIVNFNDYDEHQCATPVYGKNTTDKLKDVGYIFCKLNERKQDITDLLAYLNVSEKPQVFKIEGGDAICFNPNQVAHRVRVPPQNKQRYSLHLCLAPSPVKWDEALAKFPAKTGCRDWQAFPFKEFWPAYQDDCLDIFTNGTLASKSSLYLVLTNMFTDKSYAESLYHNILQSDPSLAQCNDIFLLMDLLKSTLLANLKADKVLAMQNFDKLEQLAAFEQEYIDATLKYSPNNKPKSNAVFWPDPTHPKNPLSKFTLTPYVKKYPIMDKHTPIGSAGSCFAFEIAQVFQEGGFNYVVAERADDKSKGVFVDGYSPGDEYAKFNANYGIMFNSPSLKQLAEKAFNVKPLTKYLVYDDKTGLFMDPYRENVFFETKKAFLEDYPQHVQAVKETFTKCKVFIFTMGLNECWELRDGTVISRNPKEGMQLYTKHKVLTVQENIESIQSFYDLVKAHNPDFKLILSVSPIPFMATGRAEHKHVIEANTHSKAVLRVAAEELVNRNEDIYYLPSYELVQECIEDAWEPDHRHVRRETVQKVVSMFKEIFVIS